MPKIRGIKPEFWTDEKVVEASPIARLLFIGLWNFACDNGHIEDRPRQIKLRILPADVEDSDALLGELHHVELIERSNGWITIPTLTDHQKPDKRYFVTCDFPGCKDAKPVVRTRKTPPPDPEEFPPDPHGDHYESTTSPHRGPHEPTRGLSTEGEGDGDGEGEGDNNRCSPVADAPAEPIKLDPDKPAPQSTPNPILDAEFETFYSQYPRKIAPAKARQAYRAARKKATLTDILAGLDTYKRTKPAYADWAHPSTWLNGERWLDQAEPDPADPWEAFRGYDPDATTEVHA